MQEPELEALERPDSLYNTFGWRALVEYYQGLCLRCKRGGGQLFAVFVQPLKLGGRATLANVQPLCGHCTEQTRNTGIDYRRQHKAPA